jgi:broad specificity phosphatase PhoE
VESGPRSVAHQRRNGLPSDAVIRTPDQRLRVFVSSTLRELADERLSVSRAISALRLTPVMFEVGARPHPPQALYRAYLSQSDIFIGLYWQLYGQIGPGMQLSGLEDEFELSRALPRLLYVKTPAPGREQRLTELLSRMRQEASYRTFRTPAELGRLVREDLATLLSERFAAARSPQAVPPPSASGRDPRSLPAAEVEPDLFEWNYGAYEGRTSADIRAERPDRQLFRDGCPGGELPDQIGARADRVVGRVRTIEGNVLLFSSGHFLRVLAARWLGLDPGAGWYLVLGTASLSAVGYEHDRSEPVIHLWDEMPHERRGRT